MTGIEARDQEGRYYKASHLVKVEPTPADTLQIFDRTGEFVDEYATPEEAAAYVERHKDDEFAPFRVARFTFAEWIDQ